MGEWDEFSRIDLEAQVSPEVLNRGLVYYEEGHLLQAVKIGSTRAGLVAGTNGNYRARLWFADNVLYTDCTCPYQGFCKHLAVVALGWLAEPDFFTDLQPELARIMDHPQLLQQAATNLCCQEPFIFLNIFNFTPEFQDFHSSRGILNLVRNIFSNPHLPLDQGEALWERVKRLQELIKQKLRCGVPEALQPLIELIEGLAAVYLDYPTEPLTYSFQEMMAVIHELPPDFPVAGTETLLRSLLAVYFEPKLWEWQQSCGQGIREVAKRVPDVLKNFVETKQLRELPTLETIAFYELVLLLKSIPGGPEAKELDRVEEELKGRSDGLLWLIDRWLDEAPDDALRLAREGLRRLEPELKVNLWDRLAQLHWRRGELKQAAAISFILFRRDPSFEEYQRLKDILHNQPLEWQEYSHKALDLLKSRSKREYTDSAPRNEGLLMKIAIVEGNCQIVRDYCAGPFQTPTIIREIAQSCLKEPIQIWRSVHPILIRSMLKTPEMWELARQFIVIYKKDCIRRQSLEEWCLFSQAILRQYEDDRRFIKKLGAILNEG